MVRRVCGFNELNVMYLPNITLKKIIIFFYLKDEMYCRLQNGTESYNMINEFRNGLERNYLQFFSSFDMSMLVQ